MKKKLPCIVCTLIALVRPLRERPEIFVEMTMWLAHLFDIIIVFAISGTNLPCRQGSMCRPSDGTKSKKENNNKTNNAKKKYQSDNNNKETFNTARGGVGVKKTDNAQIAGTQDTNNKNVMMSNIQKSMNFVGCSRFCVACPVDCGLCQK